MGCMYAPAFHISDLSHAFGLSESTYKIMATKLMVAKPLPRKRSIHRVPQSKYKVSALTSDPQYRAGDLAEILGVRVTK